MPPSTLEMGKSQGNVRVESSELWLADLPLQAALIANNKLSSLCLEDSVLLAGVLNNNENWVRSALRAGADPNRHHGAFNDSAMMLAMNVGDGHASGLIQALLQAGGNPNIPSESHNQASPFMRACRIGESDLIVQMLTDSTVAADVLIQDTYGMSASHLAVCNRRLEATGLQALQNHYECVVWKHGQAQMGERGFGLARNHLWTMVDDRGASALMEALNPAHLLRKTCAFRWMLDHPHLGMDSELEHRSQSGWTVLWHAADCGDAEQIHLLLCHGANVHAVNDSGESLLRAVAELSEKDPGKKPILDLLLAHVASQSAMSAIDGALENAFGHGTSHARPPVGMC